MSFTPTPEQFAILDRIISRTAPVIAINAGPGCAKTTTILEAIKLLAPHYQAQWKANKCKLIYTAFNRDIVNDTQAKLREANINKIDLCKVNCTTFNSLGMSLWADSISSGGPFRKISLDPKKNKAILRQIQDAGRYSISPEEWPDLEALMRLAKSQGYLPRQSGSAFGSMIDFKSLCLIGDITPHQHYQAILDAAMKISIAQSFEGPTMDFDDQLYMTALFAPLNQKVAEFFFIDECQDLTPIQLFLVKRIKSEFTILVGDPMQAIYAFRGAMSDSFARIYAIWPDAITLPLMTSFRVPKATINLLRERNPKLNTASPIDGQLLSPAESMDIKTLLATSTGTKAILCRNNAPLYRVALACISAKLPFQLSDTTFAEGLIRDIKRVFADPSNWPAGPAFIGAMNEFWMERAGDEAKLHAIIFDKLAALESLIEITHPSTISGLLLSLQALIKKSAESGVFLSTAHKAKGLEFDFVTHLDSHLIPSTFATTPEALAQESNIAYVINSRAKHTLMFLDSANITIPGTPTRKSTNPAKRETL